jgi:hypothetical protein
MTLKITFTKSKIIIILILTSSFITFVSVYHYNEVMTFIAILNLHFPIMNFKWSHIMEDIED